MKSELNAWYLDDGSLGDKFETVLEDYHKILKALRSHNLEVNPTKCELHFINPQNIDCESVFHRFNQIAPGIKVVEKEDLTLLGAPIYPEGVENALKPKLDDLELIVSRLVKIDSHQALFLLRNVFSMPKLTYFLRSSPCFLNPSILSKYDSVIKNALIKILNIPMSEEAWNQATLPISKGGLGFRPAMEVALAGYLSSVHATKQVVQSLLPTGFSDNNFFENAFEMWKNLSGSECLPQNPLFQSEWDKPMYETRYQVLLQSTTSDAEKARLLAVSSPHASDWLHSIPIPSLGLHLNPMSLKIAISLRLGSPLCHPYQCICGVMVQPNGRHGLACKKQLGRRSRHDECNKLIKRALDQAKIPSMLEPPGLTRSSTDKKRPDGLTLTTWQNGKSLIWDFTCADTLCDSYVRKSSKEPCSAAESRENKKVEKYKELAENYHFIPVGAETYGSLGPQGSKFLKDIGRKIKEVTGEKLSTFFLMQSISMAIQRGNAQCVIGTAPTSGSMEGLFEFLVHQEDT